MTDAELIEKFVAGGGVLRESVKGVTRDEALARPGPGKWSIQELVIHLADSDAIALDRMKRVISEKNPTLLSADEQAYVDHLHCDAQSLDDAVTLFALGRTQFARVLRALGPEAFDRFGSHNVAGKLTLRDLLETYTDHLDHHLAFLRQKRERIRSGVAN